MTTLSEVLHKAGELLAGWRVKLVAAAVFLLGLLQLYSPAELAALAPANWQSYVPIAVAAVIYGLEQFIKARNVDQKG